ncbi:UNVERIFIED_CONTAM: Phospholipid-transporting ATPase 1 [Sesamum radiatum]|uniref:Phospholipid-transporting ATPase 1 n=1 Tax=Sesamum radiatum TaxID=300843 RepID=A0AAW2R5S8_SESRA
MRTSAVEDAMAGRRKWKLKSEIIPDPELMKLLYKDLYGEERIAAHDFFLTLAACNTVIPIVTESPLLSGSESSLGDSHISIDYQGESPDEQALVAAASAYGYTLFERTSGHIMIDANGEKLR